MSLRNTKRGRRAECCSTSPARGFAAAAHGHWTATPVAILRRWFAAARSLSPDLHAIVQVDHVFIRETNATARYVPTDRGRRVGAMDAILRAGDIHRARPTDCQGRRKSCGADKAAAQPSRAADTSQPLGLTLDRFHARPGEAFAADPDAVAERLAVAENVIKKGVRRIDDDGAGRFLAGIADDLPFQARIELRFVALVIRVPVRRLAERLGSEKEKRERRRETRRLRYRMRARRRRSARQS